MEKQNKDFESFSIEELEERLEMEAMQTDGAWKVGWNIPL